METSAAPKRPSALHSQASPDLHSRGFAAARLGSSRALAVFGARFHLRTEQSLESTDERKVAKTAYLDGTKVYTAFTVHVK